MTSKKFTPFQHQVDAQAILKRMEKLNNGGFLCDSPGMGKTSTMSMFLKDNKIKGLPDLIVCPKSVVKTWRTELEKIGLEYGEPHKPRICLYYGTGRQEFLKDKNKWDYVITTYGTMYTPSFKGLVRRWGRVIADESHIIRNPGTATSQSMIILSQCSEYRFCVSATPFNNRYKDLMCQCMFIGKAPYNEKRWWTDKPINGESFETRVAEWKKRYLLKRTKDDILEDPTTHVIKVDALPLEYMAMKKVKEMAESVYDDFINQEATMIEIVTLITYLRMASDSFYYKLGMTSDPEKHVVVKDVVENNSKVIEILKIIDSVFSSKKEKKGIVIYSQFTSFLNILEIVAKTYYPSTKIHKIDGGTSMKMREMTIDKFNSSKESKIMFISILAGGTGINLQHASSSVIICEPYWNSFIEKQAEERVHRIGQNEHVDIYKLVMNDSIEIWIESLKTKKNILADVVDCGVIKINGVSTFSINDLPEIFKQYVCDRNKMNVDESKQKQVKNESEANKV